VPALLTGRTFASDERTEGAPPHRVSAARATRVLAGSPPEIAARYADDARRVLWAATGAALVSIAVLLALGR